MRHIPRVYADTSVFGGAYDAEFSRPSNTFFEQIRRGFFSLVISAPVRDELAKAPVAVRRLFAEFALSAEGIDVSVEALQLQEAYLTAGIVSAQSRMDALHVALASVGGCGLIVSWNFKHIVNFRKIPLYNGINLANGYGTLTICSPLEVIENEETF